MARYGRARPPNIRPRTPRADLPIANRYVDAASTAGGDGTTTATVGANRAFASLNEALSTMSGTNWVTLGQRPVINCGGTTADTVAPSVGSAWVGKLDQFAYLTITTNQPDGLSLSTSAYRLTGAQDRGLYNQNANARYLRVVRLHAAVTVGAGTFGWAVHATDSPGVDPGNIDIRFDSCRIEITALDHTHSGNGTAFWSGLSGATNRIIYTNCVAIGLIDAATGTHNGFANPGGCPVYWLNCDAYRWDQGFVSRGATNPIAKNCGAVACTDGYNGTFATGSTNNASDLASDAPGSNPRNSVTPTWRATAPDDLHLSGIDTAWRSQGTSQENDPVFRYTTDADGQTRVNWDIGADEWSVFTYTQAIDGTLTPGAGTLTARANKVLSGSLTSAGALVLQTLKLLAGSLTPSGTVTKQTSKTFSGGLTPGAGTLTARAAKVLSGTLSSSGDLTRRVTKTFDGTLTPAGDVVKRVTKTFAGSLTPAGALVRQTQKILAGALTTAGTLLTAFIRLLTVSGSLTPSGDLTRQTGKTLGGTLTPGAGTLTKLTGKVLAGSLTPTGDLVKMTSKTLTGSLTPAGDLVRQTNKSLDGTLTPGPGTVSATSALAVVLSGTLTPSGALVKQTGKNLDGSLTPAGTLTKQTTNTLAGSLAPAGSLSKQSTRTLAGTLTPSGDVARQTQKVLSGGLTPGAGTLTARAGKVLSGALTTSGAIVRSTLKVLAGVLTPSGAVVKQTRKALAGSLTPDGDLTAEKQGTTIQQSLAGSLTPTGDLVKRTGKVLGGSTSMSGAITKLSTKSLAGSLTPTGTVSKRSTHTLAGTLFMSGALVKRTYVTMAGALTPLGDVLSRLAKILSGVLFPTGDLTVTSNLQPKIAISARITLMDSFSCGVTTDTLSSGSVDATSGFSCDVEIESTLSAEVEVV